MHIVLNAKENVINAKNKITMKKMKSEFTIQWNAGGESKIVCVVEYNGNNVKKDQVEAFQKSVKTVLGNIIAGIGKNKMFGFSVKTSAEEAEQSVPYIGEKLTVKITGDNPACFLMLKGKIEGLYKAHRLGKEIGDVLSQATETAVDVSRQIMDGAGRLVSKISVTLKHFTGED